MGAAAASASLAVSSVGDALGRSGRPLARRALLSRRRPGGGRGRCSVLEAGHDANARELLAQGAHWLGEEVGDGVRHAWCPRADVEGQANVLRDDAPFQDVGRRVPDAVPVLKKLAHSDGGRGLLPLSSERFDEIAAGAVHRAASATLRPVVPDVDARQELGVAAGALLASRSKVLQLNMLLEGSKCSGQRVTCADHPPAESYGAPAPYPTTLATHPALEGGVSRASRHRDSPIPHGARQVDRRLLRQLFERCGECTPSSRIEVVAAGSVAPPSA